MQRNESIFLKHFLEIIADALIEELGLPPYPHHIMKLLSANFSLPLTEPESVPISPVSVEFLSTEPVLVPVSEPEESTVIIEWDDLQQPIDLIRSTLELAELHTASSSIVSDSTVTFESSAVFHSLRR